MRVLIFWSVIKLQKTPPLGGFLMLISAYGIIVRTGLSP